MDLQKDTEDTMDQIVKNDEVSQEIEAKRKKR